MLDLLADFVEWMRSLAPLWIYLMILVIAYGENVVPPIPGDMVVVFGGYLAGVSDLKLTIVILLSTVGGSLGFMTMFRLGARLGDAVMQPRRYRWLPKDHIRRGQKWIRKYGYGIVVANRFLSGTRSVIAIVAGMSRMRGRPVLVACTASSLIWTSLIATLGFYVGENWEVVGAYLNTYGRVTLWTFVVLVVIYAVVRLNRRSRADSEDEQQADTSSQDATIKDV